MKALGRISYQNYRNIFDYQYLLKMMGIVRLLRNSGKGMQRERNPSFLCVIGTVIGGSLIQKNQIVRGTHQLAGEFGFILYPTTDGQY